MTADWSIKRDDLENFNERAASQSFIRNSVFLSKFPNECHIFRNTLEKFIKLPQNLKKKKIISKKFVVCNKYLMSDLNSAY